MSIHKNEYITKIAAIYYQIRDTNSVYCRGPCWFSLWPWERVTKSVRTGSRGITRQKKHIDRQTERFMLRLVDSTSVMCSVEKHKNQRRTEIDRNKLVKRSEDRNGDRGNTPVNIGDQTYAYLVESSNHCGH